MASSSSSQLLLDSGPLEALTPDEAGVLREWSPKYAIITEPQTEHATLSIFSSAADVIESEPEVDIPINDCEVQISKDPAFERCFTLTANGLKVFLRGANLHQRDVWIKSIRHAAKPLPPPEMPPPMEEEEGGEEDGRASAAPSPAFSLRVTGHVYLWEDATRTWTAEPVFLYLAAGYLHEFRQPFGVLPSKSHDLTQNCAIRLRGTPPCVEMKLNEHDALLRFYAASGAEAETKDWIQSIKARALEPPAPFIDLSVAAFDVSQVEQSLAKSFFVRAGTLNAMLAGATSNFPIVGTSEDPNQLASEFTCVLSSSFESSTPELARGTFHVLADDTLALRLTYGRQGKYHLHVKFRGEHIFQSPFPVTVGASMPSAPHSVVSGRGILLASTHQVNKFVVTLRDRFLNLCNTTVDAKRLQVECFGPPGTTVVLTEKTRYLGEGSFEISYVAKSAAGEISIEVSYAGIPLAGSPFFPAFGEEEEEEVKVRQPLQQQQQHVMLPPPLDQTAQDLAMARMATEQSEAMASFLSRRIRKEWATSQHQESALQENFPQQEQLEMLLQSAALRNAAPQTKEEEEPAYLRTHQVEVNGTTWEPEPIPPPWASISLVMAQARRARRDLQECVEPMIAAAKEELNMSRQLEPKPAWKRMLLDWKGAERMSLDELREFDRQVSLSALEHRVLICAMCEAILRIEEDLDVRRRAKRQENGARLALNDDDGDDGMEEDAAALVPVKKGGEEAVNPREELRKRVQSLALGVKPDTLRARKQAKEPQYALEEEQRGGAKSHNNTTMPLLEEEEEEEKQGFALGDVVVVDGTKTGVVRHVGPTQFAQGEWIGLELVGAARGTGKNNGMVNGRKYFECPPDSGLFVRAERLALASSNQVSMDEPSPRSSLSFQDEYSEEHSEEVVEEEEESANGIWDEQADEFVSAATTEHWEEETWNEADSQQHSTNEWEYNEQARPFAAASFSEPGTPIPQQIVLSPGCLAAVVDAREIAAALKARANAKKMLSREAFVSSIKQWEPRADTQQLISLFDSACNGGNGGEDLVEYKECNPLLVCLCGTARSNRSAAFYLLDLNRSGFLERDEVERFARAVHALSGTKYVNLGDVRARARQTTDAAMRRYSALGTSLSYQEFDLWIQNTPIMAGGILLEADEERSPPLPSITPIRVDEDEWTQVQRWLEEEVGVKAAFEMRAALDSFQENGYRNLQVISQLTARDVNRLNLSFDLRLRLITKVRVLAKTRKQKAGGNDRLTFNGGDEATPRQRIAAGATPSQLHPLD